MFFIFSYGYGTRNTKKIGVLATHGDGEPPKTLDARYVTDIMYYFDNPEKTPFNYVMGDTMDQHEYFRDYRLTQKGKLLWDQIHMLHWYDQELCLRYDYTCCSRMKAPHLPFSCKFNDNETLASYANGIYDYYDVKQIEEFVAFKAAYEIESLATRPQTVRSTVHQCHSWISNADAHSTRRIYNRVAITHLLHRMSQKRTYYNNMA